MRGSEIRFDLGDGSASDATVRLASADGRKIVFATHSSVLAARCRYFAVKLAASRDLADAQGCIIELVCSERDFDHHIIFLRLLYAIHASSSDSLASCVADLCFNASNAIGVMRVASKLGSQAVLDKCLEYVEAVPWSDKEEEEVLRILRGGICSVDHPVLARLQPVDPALLREAFLSAVTAATRDDDDFSSGKIKSCAQEQIEYMLAEDDDAPLISSDNQIKPVVREKFRELFLAFKRMIGPEAATQVPENECLMVEKLADLAWASRVLSRLSLLDELVSAWCEASADIICFLEDPTSSTDEITLKAIEITSKVLDAVGYGTVLIPPTQRTGLLQAWLPFMRGMKLLLLEAELIDGTIAVYNNIQCAMNSLVLSLPAEDQAAVFADWMKNECANYPDLSEAFEVWCFRTKSAKRRLNGC